MITKSLKIIGLTKQKEGASYYCALLEFLEGLPDYNWISSDKGTLNILNSFFVLYSFFVI